MEKSKNSNFFELLCRDKKEEIEDYLLAKGKSPKAICPIIFITSENEDYYIDDVGGIHDSGVAWNLNGVFCGECSSISCKDCYARDKKE